jgi:single-strand DNA-binding protein
LLGNLGRDPDVHRTQDGRAIVQLSIATSETWRDKTSGERKERTEWHRVVIFNDGLCKVAEQYLKKGSKVYVKGQMQTRKWTDQGGVERYTTEVVLGPFNSTLVMLDGRREGVPPHDGAGQREMAPRNSGGISSGRSNDMDDDIPF